MHINYTIKETWLHKINPSFKLLVFIFLFMLAIFVHNPNILMNLTVVVLFLLLLSSGHPQKYVFLFSVSFVLLFLSSSTTMMFFGKGDTTWFRWGLIHITEESFFRGLHLGFRALYFAVLGLVFALTTRPVYLFYSLMQQLKVPPKYAYSFMAAIRIIPIMVEEFQTLHHALKVRGANRQRGFKGLYQKIKMYSIPLLAQSIRRAQRIAVAMEAKRFSQVKQRTYFYHLHYSKYDFYLILFLMAAFTLAYWIGKFYPIFDSVDVRYYN